MSIKKWFKITLFTGLGVMLLSIGVIYLYFHYEQKETVEKINTYLAENKIENKIKEKEFLYDWKIGSYYGKVVFEDEPKNFYEFYLESSNSISVIGYDENGVQITDENKGRYIDDN